MKFSRRQYSTYARLCKRVYARAFRHDVLGFEKHQMFRNHVGDQRAALLSNDREIVLVFRGTKYSYDWYSNLNCLPTRLRLSDGTTAMVHRGFNKILDLPDSKLKLPLLECIEAELTDLLATKKRSIVITGHSLGGALAILAAARFPQEIGKNVRGIYTFGQPAAGLPSLRAAYPFHDSTFRVCAGVDAVTFLPPLFYRHVGKQYWIHDGNIYQDVPWYSRIARATAHAFAKLVNDHEMEKYIKHEDYWKAK